MKSELEDILIEKHPTLFRDYGKSPQESCMAFGVEFGDGWYNIFADLCDYLDKLADHEDVYKLKDEFKTEENRGYIVIKRPTIHFDQVKEKFGTMRVYWSMDEGMSEETYNEIHPKERDNIFKFYEEIEGAIRYVEFLSSRTCEVCGKPGKLETKGWYKVRCTDRFCGK